MTLTNTGTGAFTAANPARLVDDLTGVLDDATYQGDAAATVDGVAVAAPTYAAPRISWSGPLAAGQVRGRDLLGGAQGWRRRARAQHRLRAADADTRRLRTARRRAAVPCDTAVFELPKLTITKTANRTALPSVGQTIVYTVTVTNTGLGDFTAAHPATFSDDLSAVLDDTQPLLPGNITATRGTATFTSPTLSWSGALLAGQDATITYTLTYTGAGDQVLVNNACIPADEAVDPADSCRTVSVPGSGLRHHKSVDPASGTPVEVGQVLHLRADLPERRSGRGGCRHLRRPLRRPRRRPAGRDAGRGPGLTAAVAGNQLEITGSVPAGETRTVTYQVQVRPWAAQGDHVLANVLACEPGEPAGCAPEATTNPVRHLTLTKTSDASVDSMPGDTVTYRVTATNDGTGDWTAADPTTVVDDLTGLLDDATYGDDATAERRRGPDVRRAADHLDRCARARRHGDDHLHRDAQGRRRRPRGQRGLAAGARVAPARRRTARPRRGRAPSTSFDLPKLTIKKTSNRAQLPAAGQKITYAVTVTNPGPGDYTAAHPATFSDDLADVLDDATFDAGSITATAVQRRLNGTSSTGAVCWPRASPATVTYTLTYQEHRQPRRGQPRLHPGRRGPGPGRHLPHRAHPGLGTAALQVGRPGERDLGGRGAGPHLHADLRERRARRRDGRHLRRPLRRGRRRDPRSPARSPPTPG